MWLGMDWVVFDWNVRLWHGVLRPLLQFAVGITCVLGISRLVGILYWAWLIMSTALIIEWLVPVVSSGLGAAAWSPAAVVEFSLWLLATGLLLAPSSLHADWRYGRLKSAVG